MTFLFYYYAIGVLLSLHRLAMLRQLGLLEHLLYMDANDTNQQHRWLKLTIFVIAGSVYWPLWAFRRD